MIFFKKKRGLEISNHITAIDGKVIARQGDRIDYDFLENLIALKTTPTNFENSLENTPFFNNFEVLLKQPKYSFISTNSENKDHLLAILAPIKLNEMFIKELNYLKRQPYHFHHTKVDPNVKTKVN